LSPRFCGRFRGNEGVDLLFEVAERSEPDLGRGFAPARNRTTRAMWCSWSQRRHNSDDTLQLTLLVSDSTLCSRSPLGAAASLGGGCDARLQQSVGVESEESRDLVEVAELDASVPVDEFIDPRLVFSKGER